MDGEVLVVGARGRIGREVVRGLRAAGARVVSLVRAASPQPVNGVREVVGDLRNRRSLDAALAGITSAFFTTPHAEDEEAIGRAFVDASGAAGVRRLVFSSAYHANFTTSFGFALFVRAAELFTHYGPKLRVEQRVRRSGLSPVVLLPSNFFQNDELFLEEIRAGCYPQPLGFRGVNRVDCRDIGDAAVRALTDLGLPSGAYPLVGAERALTGPECADLWARALGREVRYDGELERWRTRVADRMHAREREDFGKTYRLFQRMRVAASASDLARLTALLGRAPRSYAAYVAERAAGG